MFAVTESYQESLGFSPFEVIFGRMICGPLKLVKEIWLSENPPNFHLLDYVDIFRGRLDQICELGQTNLKHSQGNMKRLYEIERKVSELDCVIKASGCRNSTQFCQ